MPSDTENSTPGHPLQGKSLIGPQGDMREGAHHPAA